MMDEENNIRVRDILLKEDKQREVNEFLRYGLVFGWKSSAGKDVFSFFHRHFAGAKHPDHPNVKDHEQPYDCTEELKSIPLLASFWASLSGGLLKGHRLVRCYANGAPYGCEGTLHTDAVAPRSYTSVYYPHLHWYPNWGGETVFFNQEKTDIIASVYPKPNRLCTFAGMIPHVARGVSRTCPVMRVTLMFKTDIPDAAAES